MQIIPDLEAEYSENFKPLHHGMLKFGEYLAQDRPDLIILATPHGYQTENTFLLYNSGHYRIYYPKLVNSNVDGPDIQSILMVQSDPTIVSSILSKYRNLRDVIFSLDSLSLATSHYPLPLAWGASVPLFYMKQFLPNVPTVIISLPRKRIDLQNFRAELNVFGRFLADNFIHHPKRISFVFSGDLSHTHQETANFSYHPSCKQFDAMFLKGIKDISKISTISDALIDLNKTALSCGLSTMLIFEGMQQKCNETHTTCEWQSELIEYQVPTYFGMAIGRFTPTPPF